MQAKMALGMFLLTGLLFHFSCATFDGNLATPDHQNLIVPYEYYAKTYPISARPTMRVFFELPEVVDQDDGKDFTPIADVFARAMQKYAMDYFCRRGVFSRCTDERHEGDFLFKSTVFVKNYRNAYGGVPLAVLGGLLFPPVIGMAWSFPVAAGSCTMGFSFALVDPRGQEIWHEEIAPQGGYQDCMDDSSTSRLLMDVFEKFLTRLNGAALAHEQELQKSQEQAERKLLAEKAAAELLSEKELLQLTAYLSTAMAASGRYTVVPREQLRQRLLEEKTSSYRACYDESCQIELGKAVAASKTLATQLLKVGSQCVVTANLFDLKTETSVRAAKVNTECLPQALLKALDEVSEQLSR
jgi:hypothetical protein